MVRYLVATGKPTPPYSDNGVKTEVVDLSDPSQSCLLDAIAGQHSSAGGLIGTTPVLCGGYKLPNTCLNELNEFCMEPRK